jgi:hypothetical protein
MCSRVCHAGTRNTAVSTSYVARTLMCGAAPPPAARSGHRIYSSYGEYDGMGGLGFLVGGIIGSLFWTWLLGKVASALGAASPRAVWYGYVATVSLAILAAATISFSLLGVLYYVVFGLLWVTFLSRRRRDRRHPDTAPKDISIPPSPIPDPSSKSALPPFPARSNSERYVAGQSRLKTFIGFACGISVSAGLVLYAYVLPYTTASRLQAILSERRFEDVGDLVDVDALRLSVRGQIDDCVADSVAAGGSDGVMDTFAGPVSTSAIEKFVDSIGTPSGVARMLSTIDAIVPPVAGPDAAAIAVGSLSSLLSFKTDQRWSSFTMGYTGVSRFDIVIPTRRAPTKLTLRRSGLSWKLASVSLPRHGILNLLPGELRQALARRQTREATENINLIFQALAKFQRTVKREDPLSSAALGIQLALTPAQTPCGGTPHSWSADEVRLWSVIGFEPQRPTRYSYNYGPAKALGLDDGRTPALIQALGDLDCDGTTSKFELAVGVDNQGELYHARGFYVVNEIE